MDENYIEGEVYLKDSFYYPWTKDEIDKVSTLVRINDNKNSNVAGKINVYLDKKEIGQVPIYKKAQKKKENFFQKIKNLFIR